MLEPIAYGADCCTNLNIPTTAIRNFFKEISHIATFVRFGHEMIDHFRSVIPHLYKSVSPINNDNSCKANFHGCFLLYIFNILNYSRLDRNHSISTDGWRQRQSHTIMHTTVFLWSYNKICPSNIPVKHAAI